MEMNTNNRSHGAFRLLEIIISWFVFMCFSIVLFFRDKNVWDSISKLDYFDILISEWLINYEGGFVRRGITGQSLYFFEQICLFDVRFVIVLIIIILSCIVLLLLLHICKKEGWPILLIPSGCCLGFTIFNLFGRRDLLSLLITFFIFLLYRKTRSEKGGNYVIAFYGLGILQLLIHEASFFYTFPILMLDTYMQNRCDYSFKKNLTECVFRFSPILVSMLLVSVFHGNHDMADQIWASWKMVFMAYPDGTDNEIVGSGLQYLDSSLLSAAKYHLSVAYKGGLNPAYWRCLLVFFNYISIYYLYTRINSVNMGIHSSHKTDNVFLSNTFIVQFICMIPMFTILSCDWGRTIPYLGITTLFFYFLFHDNNSVAFPSPINKWSSVLQEKVSSNHLLSSPFFYLFVLLVTPIPSFDAPDFTERGHNTFQYMFIYLLTLVFN